MTRAEWARAVLWVLKWSAIAIAAGVGVYALGAVWAEGLYR